MGWKFVLEMCWPPDQMWQQSLVPLLVQPSPAHPTGHAHTHSQHRKSRLCMLGMQNTWASGKQSRKTFTSPFPSVSFNNTEPRTDPTFLGQDYFCCSAESSPLHYFCLNCLHIPGGRLSVPLFCLLYDRNYLLHVFKKMTITPKVLCEIAFYHNYPLNIFKCFEWDYFEQDYLFLY